MKLFKKLFSIIALCIGCVILAASVGCNNLSEGDGWVEVQSITYTTGDGTTTLTSECVWDTTSVDISKSEYDNALDGFKPDVYEIPPSVLDIELDRIAFKTKVNHYIGNSYYYYNPYTFEYKKTTYTCYILNYVKIKTLSDKVIEIAFKDEVKQVSTISYEITYFIN